MIKNRGLRRSLTDFTRHPWLHFISISTICVALVILGSFFICSRNFDRMAEKTSPHVTGTVYLKEGLVENEIKTLETRLQTLEGIQSVIFKTRNVVVQDLQAFLGGAGMNVLPGTELFPDVIELQMNADTSEAIIAKHKQEISSFQEVAEVDFSEDWLAQYKRVRQTIKVFGWLLLMGILVGCSFIIANFMGMRHQSRKHEIDTVWLIGAHRNFILAPFLWEAAIEGILGTLISLTILVFIKGLMATLISTHWVSLMGIREWLFLSPAQIVLLLFVGMGMAFAGSITVFLRFQEN